MAFSIVRNGDREIDFSNINYLDSKFKFISVESVDKMLKQSDSISLKLVKRDLNLKVIEKLINKNSFISSADVSLELNGELGVRIVEKEPVFRVLDDDYYIDLSGSIMPLSENYSERIPLILSEVDSTELKSLGLLGNYFKNDTFLSNHITGLEIIDNEFLFHVNSFKYLIKMKDLSDFKSRFTNYKVFYKTVINDSVLVKLKSINLNFKNQVIVQKR
jgi:cell division protein FtsQ